MLRRKIRPSRRPRWTKKKPISRSWFLYRKQVRMSRDSVKRKSSMILSWIN